MQIKDRIIPYAKLLFLLSSVLFLQEGIAEQLRILTLSENPVRNISVFVTVWLLAILGFLAPAFSSNRYLRRFWGIFFGVSILAYLSFKNIMGYAPSLGDAKLMWIEKDQGGAALLFYWPEFIAPTLFTIIFILIYLHPTPVFRIRWSVFARIRPLFSASAPTVPLFMLSGMLIMKGGAAGNGIPAGTYGLGAYAATIAYEINTTPVIPRSVVPYQHKEEDSIRNIVLVVDESISGDFITPVSGNPLLPALATNPSLIVDFGIASAGHNCSSFSNLIMRWGLTENNLSNAERNPTIWQYAKKAGFVTTYVDAQKQPGTYGNFMNLHEAKDIDNFVQFKSPQIERDREYIRNDFRAADVAIDLIAKKQKNFIYINKLGAHFPYEGKYPENEARYTPHMGLFEPIRDVERTKLINSYMNVISWNLNGFFEILLDRSALDDTVVIYTSDHGQNLKEKGDVTHCVIGKLSAYQGLVPMILISGNSEIRSRFTHWSRVNKDKTSHFNVFPTLLALMGYPKEQVRMDYGPSLDSPIKRLGAFAVGNLLTNPPSARVFRWERIPEDLPARLKNPTRQVF